MSIYYLHALQLQAFPFHERIRILNWLKFETALMCSGKSFQRTAAAYLKECFPYVVLLTLGMSTMLEYLKLYLLFLKRTKLSKQGGATLYRILKVSRAIVLIRLISKDGTLAVIKSCSYELS